jgi:hypothetical protein
MPAGSSADRSPPPRMANHRVPSIPRNHMPSSSSSEFFSSLLKLRTIVSCDPPTILPACRRHDSMLSNFVNSGKTNPRDGWLAALGFP